MSKIVAFVGDETDFFSSGKENLLVEIIRDCINEGYDTFYCSSNDYFDNFCLSILCDIKKKNKNIKIFRLCSKGIVFDNILHTTDLIEGLIIPNSICNYDNYYDSEELKWLVKNVDMLICYLDIDCIAYRTIGRLKRDKNVVINLK